MNKLEQFKNVGWIENTTGECPVPEGTLIRIRFESDFNHESTTDKPQILLWNLDNVVPITHYQTLEVGKCQNGDPIVIGAEYVRAVNSSVVTVLGYFKDIRRPYKVFDMYTEMVYGLEENQFHKRHKPPVEDDIIEVNGVRYKRISDD